MSFAGDAKAVTHGLLNAWVIDVLGVESGASADSEHADANNSSQAQITLEDWRIALLDGATAQWNIYRDRLNKQIIAQAQADRAYLNTSAEIDRLHRDAERLAAANAIQAASLKYREADRLAEARKSEYPKHIRLQVLAEHEHALREQKAMAAETGTSAVQFGLWRTTISGVKRLPPNEPVVMFDPETGQTTGTKPAIEAAPELEHMARNASGKLAEDYAQEALQLIQDHNPLGALERLKRRSEIEDYLPDGTSRKQLDDAQAAAKESLKRLEQAQGVVPQALDRLGGDGERAGLDAWEKLYEVPPDFRAAGFVLTATNQIVARMRTDIEKQQSTAQQAFEQAQFDTALTLINRVDEAYKDTTLERGLDRNNPDDKAVLNKFEPIARVRREMLTQRGQIADITDRLVKARATLLDLRSLAATDPTRAYAELERLRASFSPVVLTLPPDLNTVASVIQSHLDTSVIIEGLNRSLDDTNTATITDVIDQIQKIIEERRAQNTNSDVSSFRKLLQIFQTRLTFLQAKTDRSCETIGRRWTECAKWPSIKVTVTRRWRAPRSPSLNRASRAPKKWMLNYSVSND